MGRKGEVTLVPDSFLISLQRNSGNKVNILEELTDTYTLRDRRESSYVRGNETGVLGSNNKAQKDRKLKFHIPYNLQ